MTHAMTNQISPGALCAPGDSAIRMSLYSGRVVAAARGSRESVPGPQLSSGVGLSQARTWPRPPVWALSAIAVKDGVVR